jgi:uncharacterized protein (TIGR02284 family)
METIEKSVEVLNDLIEINNDRIAGFEHATKDLSEGDADLKAIFEKFSSDSRKNVQELTAAVNQVGGEADNTHSAGGTIHRAWLDVKATFTGHDRKSVLAECERGEDAIKKAYKDALVPESGLSTENERIIARQQEGIIAAHEQIKFLRDRQAE